MDVNTMGSQSDSNDKNKPEYDETIVETCSLCKYLE